MIILLDIGIATQVQVISYTISQEIKIMVPLVGHYGVPIPQLKGFTSPPLVQMKMVMVHKRILILQFKKALIMQMMVIQFL